MGLEEGAGGVGGQGRRVGIAGAVEVDDLAVGHLEAGQRVGAGAQE
ncbi:hypothetical protein ABZX62_26830 [Streptomyces flavidovirens]